MGTRAAKGRHMVRKPARDQADKSAKAKIRGLQRLLAHRGPSLSPAARASKEAEIASLTSLVADRKHRERERRVIGKYRMVRFFERRKIQRSLEKVQRRLNGADANKNVLQEKKRKLEEDLFYVLNFPKNQPYVSLFPSSGHDQESQAALQRHRTEVLSSFHKT